MRSQGLKQGAGSVLDAHVLTLGLSGLTGAVLGQELSLQGNYCGPILEFSFSLVPLWQVVLLKGGREEGREGTQ